MTDIGEAAAEIERLDGRLRLAIASLTSCNSEVEQLRIWEVEVRLMRARVCERDTEIERLRAILHDLRPDIERLAFCEASAEDGNTPRLQMLRRALEPKT